MKSSEEVIKELESLGFFYNHLPPFSDYNYYFTANRVFFYPGGSSNFWRLVYNGEAFLSYSGFINSNNMWNPIDITITDIPTLLVLYK